jgi:dTDP-4-dehydrorhamnose reductase
MPRVLALIGAGGMLARKVRELAPSGYAVHGFDLPGFDITDRPLVLAEMAALGPAVIVNCAAFTDVDGAESREDLATLVNGAGPGHLAEAARQCEAVLVHISTDYVFAGDKGVPYREEDPTGPLSAYGRSKLAGERAIAASGLERHFILRTSWLYGPGGKNFVETMLRLAAEREELRVVADQVGSPTYTGDLAAAIFRLLALAELPAGPGPFGVYHFANRGECSWHGFATQIVASARAAGIPLKVKRIVPIATGDYPLPARRPAYSALAKDKYLSATGAAIPPWQESLELYLRVRAERG